MADIRIGTSGWHYKHWLGTFYPAKTAASSMLAFYQTQFNTVELNNSFYHLPSKISLQSWRDSTPEDFQFAVKASRFLTHMKKLNDAEQGLERFLDTIEELGKKLGPILFQLPPNWDINVERFEKFVDLLPADYSYAFEFRNATWNTPEIEELLSARNLAYCVYDLAGYQSPVKVTADFAYIRLHGPGAKYQGSYSDSALLNWTEQLHAWSEKLRAAYVYFDNDQSGYAAQDALRLIRFVSQKVDTTQ